DTERSNYLRLMIAVALGTLCRAYVAIAARRLENCQQRIQAGPDGCTARVLNTCWRGRSDSYEGIGPNLAGESTMSARSASLALTVALVPALASAHQPAAVQSTTQTTTKQSTTNQSTTNREASKSLADRLGWELA